MFNIVLVEPEIPQNTGNIARTCAATGCRLYLVRPLGFSIDEKQVRRAGLDYWDKVDIRIYDSLDEIMRENPDAAFYFSTTRCRKNYTEQRYEKGCFIVFGKETAGLPASLLSAHPEQCMRIPMRGDLRSLNLSNAVAVILYEALRQNGFEGLE
ncbi:MAG: tRNA (cytidine(34)-2'-O)-methyltransferase [Bacillota bacterium]|nr:tRNA (cytidine(34)-2'-O)-methyltransferase [Bacillota bacterium]